MGNSPPAYNKKEVEKLNIVNILKQERKEGKDINIILLGETHGDSLNNYKKYLDDFILKNKKICALLECDSLRSNSGKNFWRKKLEKLLQNDLSAKFIGCDILRNQALPYIYGFCVHNNILKNEGLNADINLLLKYKLNLPSYIKCIGYIYEILYNCNNSCDKYLNEMKGKIFDEEYEIQEKMIREVYDIRKNISNDKLNYYCLTTVDKVINFTNEIIPLVEDFYSLKEDEIKNSHKNHLEIVDKLNAAYLDMMDKWWHIFYILSDFLDILILGQLYKQIDLGYNNFIIITGSAHTNPITEQLMRNGYEMKYSKETKSGKFDISEIISGIDNGEIFNDVDQDPKSNEYLGGSIKI